MSCLPDDYFILSQTLLHYTIKYTKIVVTDSCYLSVVFSWLCFMYDFCKILEVYSYLAQKKYGQTSTERILLNYTTTPLIPLLNGTCHASTCKIETQDSRRHLAAMVFLLSKCYTSNLDIITDQNQNVTHPPQFEVIINGICKWYSRNMS